MLIYIYFKMVLILRISFCVWFGYPGTEKEHLKVTLLRIDSSLQGVSSCLPDFKPSSTNGPVEGLDYTSFLIAGAAGSRVGSTALREKAANVIHAACK